MLRRHQQSARTGRTNVVKLYEIALKTDDRQRVYYLPGLGTMGSHAAVTRVGRGFTQLAGLIAGSGIRDEVSRSAIDAHGGFPFKHTGDGVVAAFSWPKSAVEAAIAAQREWQLPVRMGLATGNP